MGEKLRIVMVEPGKPAYVAKIPPTLEAEQFIVGGPIATVRLDEGILVYNDEGKLREMEGNRRLDNGSIIAGPFFLVGDGGDRFRSLTDTEVDHFLQRFAQPEQISQREVWADMGFKFLSF